MFFSLGMRSTVVIIDVEIASVGAGGSKRN